MTENLPYRAPSTAYGPMPWAIGQADHWPGTAKVMEECGELIQVLAKLIALGKAAVHWDGSDLRERIVEEVGDVYGALRFFSEHNLTSEEIEAVADRCFEKYQTFTAWHNERSVGAPQNDPYQLSEDEN